MSNNAAPPSGNGGNLGNASDNAEETVTVKVSDLNTMLETALNKALGPRLKRETSKLSESLEQLVQRKLGAMVQPSEQAPMAAAPTAIADEPEKLNLKTLDARFKAIQDELAKERQARKEAEDRAVQTRVKADLHSTFAKHAGADNPHLPLYLDKYSSQFRVHEGKTYRAVSNEYGEEQLVPLEQAASEMFAGELKHLVPSAQPRLPSTGLVRGMPMNGNAGNAPRLGIFEREILHAQAMSDPDLHDALYNGKQSK